MAAVAYAAARQAARGALASHGHRRDRGLGGRDGCGWCRGILFMGIVFLHGC
jgi:hypothetical protein